MKGGRIGGVGMEPSVIVSKGEIYLSPRQAKMIKDMMPNGFGNEVFGTPIIVSSALAWPAKKLRHRQRSVRNNKNPRKRKHGRQTRTKR